MLQAVLVNGRPHYATEMLSAPAPLHRFHLYWAPDGTNYISGLVWVLATDEQYHASTAEIAYTPEKGGSLTPFPVPSATYTAESGRLNEACNGQWITSGAITLMEEFSNANCAEIAVGLLVSNIACACEGGCPLSCAQQVSAAADQCAAQLPPFTAAIGQAFYAECVATVQNALMSVPSTLDISGFSCHPSANEVYLLQPTPMYGRPHYISASGTWHLFSRHFNGGGVGTVNTWGIELVHTLSTDMTTQNPIAIYLSDSFLVPTSNNWGEFCSQAWGNQPAITVVESLSAVACTALGAGALADPKCAMGVGSCGLPCAELVMSAATRCSARATAFATAVGRHLFEQCPPVVQAALMTVPSSIQVEGFTGSRQQCNAEYILQAVTLNGRPHYATSDARWHLGWSPADGKRGTGCAAWTFTSGIGVLANGQSVVVSDTTGVVSLDSENDLPPAGTDGWVYLHDTTDTIILTLTPRYNANWCATVLSEIGLVLQSSCCLPSDGPVCGAGEGLALNLPAQCTADCASKWADIVAQCPSATHSDLSESTLTFFSGCDNVQVLATTVELADGAACEDSLGLHRDLCQDLQFDATPGNRYMIYARSQVAGSDPCTVNNYDVVTAVPQGYETCDVLLSSGTATCKNDFSPSGQYPHYCDFSCGFICDSSGVSELILELLPPDSTASSDLVETDRLGKFPSKGLAFVASYGGRYTLRLLASTGSGSVSVSITTAGTAVARAPVAHADGQAYPLTVGCFQDSCNFAYAGSMMSDGDKAGFVLRLPPHEAGTTLAIAVRLGANQSGAHVRATVFEPSATAGAAAFQPVIDAPMGSWTRTPSGHHSVAEHFGCQNRDRSCIATSQAGPLIRHGFGFHPGGTFESHDEATIVLSSADPTLLRLEVRCDVPFYADVEHSGCFVDDGETMGCLGTGAYSYVASYSRIAFDTCTAGLELTITTGARYESSEADAQMAMMFLGSAQQIHPIVLSQSEAEAQMATMFHAQHPEINQLPPTLSQALVCGSEAQAQFATMFTVHQQPHIVYPLDLSPTGNGVIATVATTAPNEVDAHDAASSLTESLGGSAVGGRRRLQSEAEAQMAIMFPPCGLGDPGTGTARECTVAGQMHLVSTFDVSQQELEAQAAVMFPAQADHITLDAPPTMDQMLVPNSEASALMAQMFVQQQQPRFAYPIVIQPLTLAELAEHRNGCAGLAQEMPAIVTACCGSQMCSGPVPDQCDAGCAPVFQSFLVRCSAEVAADPNVAEFNSFHAACNDLIAPPLLNSSTCNEDSGGHRRVQAGDMGGVLILVSARAPTNAGNDETLSLLGL